MNENAEREEWVLVPREPTPEMLAMGDEAMVDTIDTHNWLNHCRNAWAAMLAAAPPPPVQGEVTGQASSSHAAAMARITEAGRRLSHNVDLAQSLATFSDFWGLDCYTPQTATMNAVRDIVRALLALSQAAPPAATLAQAEGHSTPAGVTSEELRRIDPIHPDFAGAVAVLKPELGPESLPHGFNAVEVAREAISLDYLGSDTMSRRSVSEIKSGHQDHTRDMQDAVKFTRRVLKIIGIPDLSQGEE